MFESLFLNWTCTFITGVITSIIATIPGTILYLSWKKKIQNKQLRKILNFGEDDIVFVFTHREFKQINVQDETPQSSTSILPRTSTEDFMAINNIKTALLKINSENRDKIKDTDTFLNRIDDKKNNIISICSSKSNKFTKEVEETLLKKRKRFFRTVYNSERDRWEITDGDGYYPTSAEEQYKGYIENGISLREIPTKKFDDFAYITKITNPQNRKNKIFIIAGIKGIGTWGAAECLKKEYNQIYENLPQNKKDCDFSALINIEYDNLDITKIVVNHVIPFID